MATKEKQLNFEQALTRLEEISASLQTRGVALDKSLELYEEGIGLIKACNKYLADAEIKVKVLSENMNNDKVEEDE